MRADIFGFVILPIRRRGYVRGLRLSGSINVLDFYVFLTAPELVSNAWLSGITKFSALFGPLPCQHLASVVSFEFFPF